MKKKSRKSKFEWRKLSAQQYQDLIDIKRYWRQWNHSHHFLFLSIGMCISLLFVNAAFSWRTEVEPKILDFSRMDTDLNELLEIPVSKQPPPPPPKKAVDLFVIKEVEEEVIEEIQVSLDVEVSEEMEIEEVVYEEAKEEIVEEVFTIVETFPKPAGGMKAFNEYVYSNIKYPTSATRMGIGGRVFVKFVVEKDGSLTDIHVVKGIGAGCDEEAMRVLAGAPNWEPGKQRGKPVRVQMILPIMFVLK